MKTGLIFQLLILFNLSFAQPVVKYEYLNCQKIDLDAVLSSNRQMNGYQVRYSIDTVKSVSLKHHYGVVDTVTVHINKIMEGNFENGKKNGFFLIYLPPLAYDGYENYDYLINYKNDSIENTYFLTERKSGDIVHKASRIGNSKFGLIDDLIIYPESSFKKYYLLDLETEPFYEQRLVRLNQEIRTYNRKQ
jgi:hypothetical protein